MQLGLHLETDCIFSIQVPQKRTELLFAYFGPVIFIRNQRHPMYSFPYDPSTLDFHKYYKLPERLVKS